MKLLFSILCLFTLSIYCEDKQKIGPWNLTELYKTPKWKKTDKAQKEGVSSLLYSSINFEGKAVEVFAYYSAPKGKMPKGGWPAVVCVHGGGGTAFDAWVKEWNKNGFAAISMDLEGHYPIGSHKKGREATENPGPSRVGVFHDFDKAIEQQWYYHAVAQIILAHSLIRSFPEVNPEKTGITGVSWGGNLTSTTMGVDSRFQFAIPAYGCGFLPGSDGHQGRAIKKGKHWDTVANYYDGSAYFKNMKMPVLWVNGTNDYHFAMPATQKSSQSISGKSTLRYQVEMKHGHGPVWKTKECYEFAKHVIYGTAPLLKIDKPKINGKSISISINGDAKSAVLNYTTDADKIWPDRKWKEIKTNIDGSTISANIPKNAIAVFFNVTDKNNLMVSSEFIEIPKE